MHILDPKALRPVPGAVLVTGGCGFIGSNLVRFLRTKRPQLPLIVLDRFTYAGNPENLQDLSGDPMVQILRGDVADRKMVAGLMLAGVERVVNVAAETHVDRSIMDASEFIHTNVTGTQILVEEATRAKCKQFVQVSTDEVYGSLPPPQSATPESQLRPSSPYSASKAAADLLLLAWHHTFGAPVVITRATNNYGPYQFPEKLLPLMITNALEDKPLPVYGNGLQVRDWLHVEDHCAGLLAALEGGKPGEIYHLGSGAERTNLDMVRQLLTHLGKPDSLIRNVADRPGHDLRYSLDTTATRKALGWQPRYDQRAGLKETIDWYLAHRPWWEKIKSGQYRKYYESLYGERTVLTT